MGFTVFILFLFLGLTGFYRVLLGYGSILEHVESHGTLESVERNEFFE